MASVDGKAKLIKLSVFISFYRSRLFRMNLNIEPVRGALQALQSDVDPRVRAEASQALTYLTSQPAAVQPVRAQ